MKIYGYLIALLATLVLHPAISQNPATKTVKQQRSRLYGMVKDLKNGQPLAGATVYIPDLKAGASTDSRGHYSLVNLPAGRHLVEVSFVGYGSEAITIDIRGDIQHEFELSPSIVESNEVVVTAVSQAMKARRSPAAVSLVKRSDLLSSVSVNLVDALSRNPGISQISTGPAISKPVIRGLGYNRVVVVNDGVRQEGQQWGDEHGIEIDEYSVSRVEIIKGPASIMYGSDALAGVINVTTNMPVPEGSIRGSILANYQSNNRLRGTGLTLGGNRNGFNWSFWGTYKDAGDYKNRYDGYVFNSKYNERNAGGYLGWNGAWGYSHLILSRFDQHLGLIEGERNSQGQFVEALPGGQEKVPGPEDFKSVIPGIPYQHIIHSKITSENSVNLGSGRLNFILGYQRNQRMEYGNPDDPGERELYFDLNTGTYNIIYHFNNTNGWGTVAGLNGMWQQNQNRGSEALIPDYDLFDAGIFIYTQKSWSKFTTSAGLRFDTRHISSKYMEDAGQVKFSSAKKSFSAMSGSAGISYLLNRQVSFKFNIAKGYRAPSIPELFSNGAHEGTSRYEFGNTDLKPESSVQADLGLDLNTDHLSLQLSAFVNSVDHFIYYRKLLSVNGGDSLISDGSNQIPAYRFEQQKALLAGWEARVDIHPHPLDWLHFENSFSYVQGRFNKAIEGSKNLPLIPATRLLSELRGDFLKRGDHLIKQLSVHLDADINFAEKHPFTGYDTETATDGYVLWNAGVNFDLERKSKTMATIYFMVNNFTDVAYQNHLSRLKYTDENLLTGRMGVFNQGRNFSIKLLVPLQWDWKGSKNSD